jgi:hypothetical protein
MQKKKNSIKNRTSAKQRIQKSDEIIVVAKTPIEEIIKETTAAKQVRDAIRKISKHEKTIEAKITEPKIKENDAGYCWARVGFKTTYTSGNYDSESKPLDYEKLFSYLSRKSKNTSDSYESVSIADINPEKEIVSDRELTAYVDRLMILSLVGGINDSSFEEKEKMRHYAMFNRSRVSMKLNLSSYKLTDNIDLDRSI